MTDLKNNIPSSMQTELISWNDGDGISLDTWIYYHGNFELAVGYCTLFNPTFAEYDDYLFEIARYDDNPFDSNFIARLRGWETNPKVSKQGVEYLFNRIRLVDIHYDTQLINGIDTPDGNKLSSDKLLYIGHTLKEIYQAKLAYCYPRKPCEVVFDVPEDSDALDEYVVSFWQKKHNISKEEY